MAEGKLSNHCEEVVWTRTSKTNSSLPITDKWITKKNCEVVSTWDQELVCQKKELEKLNELKDKLKGIPFSKLDEIRKRANPFESIGKSIFINRSAVKMANLNDIFGSIIVDNLKQSPSYFADICGGPGGFCDFILWKTKGKCKGFGITLKSKDDYEPHRMFHHKDKLRIVYGKDGTGDIYKYENRISFERCVMDDTGNDGVDLAMADGAFEITGNEQYQETLYQRILLCQFVTALRVMKEGGHFVTNYFDIFAPFSVALVYLMGSCFEKFSIVKPLTSRPANSERFIVFKNKRYDCNNVIEYLDTVDEIMSTSHDGFIQEIVPIDVLKADDNFLSYVKRNNMNILKHQTKHLQKILLYHDDKSLKDDERDVIQHLLRKWGLPGKINNPYNNMTQQFRKELPVRRFYK